MSRNKPEKHTKAPVDLVGIEQQKAKLQSKIDELTPKLKRLDEAKYEAAGRTPEESKAAHDKWWEAYQEYTRLVKQLQKMEKSGQ